MTDIPKQTLSELINNIKTKKISSEEATKAFIDRSEKSRKLNVDEELSKIVRNKTNEQLNQFSNLFLNKFKKDIIINEL